MKKVYDEHYFKGLMGVYRGGYESTREYIKKFAREVLCKFQLNNGKSLKALDVGCAYGYVVEVLLELGYDAYGCDISSYAVNKANELHKWKRCFVVDICKEPLVEKYHLITMFNTIEHLYDIESNLLNIKTSLYSGGFLLVQTVNPLNLFILLDKDPTHINIHSPCYWRQIFRKFFKYVVIRNYKYLMGKMLIPFPLFGQLTIIVAR